MYTTTGAEQCFECKDAPYPRDCSKVTVCGDDEVSFVSNNVWYM